MELFITITVILIAGAAGGIVNVLLQGDQIIMPRLDGTNRRCFKPGIIKNLIIGATAAFITWGLSQPASGIDLFSTTGEPITLHIGAIANAIIIGMGGAFILSRFTNEGSNRENPQSSIETTQVTVKASRKRTVATQ